MNVLRCPVCRQECMDVDVMENFFVRDSVEIPSSTVDKPVQVRDYKKTLNIMYQCTPLQEYKFVMVVDGG